MADQEPELQGEADDDQEPCEGVGALCLEDDCRVSQQ